MGVILSLPKCYMLSSWETDSAMRFECWKCIKEHCWDIHLWKRREGGRIEQREKVGSDAVRMTSACTLLPHWMQAAPGDGGDESFLN